MFETDADGNITPRSLLGWKAGKAFGTTLLLELRTAGSDEELQAGGAPLLMCLAPQQALELAQVLARAAQSLLGQKPGGQPS